MKILSSNPRTNNDLQSPTHRGSRKSFLFVFTAHLVLIGSGWFPSVLSAQPAQPETPAVATGLSTIFVTARAKDGSRIELSTSDVEIKVDKTKAIVREVHRVVEVALNYAIVLDRSGSEREQFQLQKDAATQLLSKIVQTGRDRGILVSFNDTFRLDAEGVKPQEFVDAIAREDPRGGSALYDAVVNGVDRISQSATAPSVRLMFILSDGGDNASHVDRDTAIFAALKNGIRVYAIGQRGTNPNMKAFDDRSGKALRQFAERTGGKAYFPEKREDIAKAVTDISDELTNLFSITYTLRDQHADGQLHKLEVKCGKKDASITGPDRYYAAQP